MDRGAWWGAVRGVAESQPWLSDCTHAHTGGTSVAPGWGGLAEQGSSRAPRAELPCRPAPGPGTHTYLMVPLSSIPRGLARYLQKATASAN